MALVQIQVLSGGHVIWAKESAAAKLVAQGKAEYAVPRNDHEPAAAISPPGPAPAAKPKKGRR